MSNDRTIILGMKGLEKVPVSSGGKNGLSALQNINR